MSEILAVKLKETTEGKKPSSTGLTLHYIQKNPKYIWKHGVVEFTSDSQQVAAQWTSKLEELMQPHSEGLVHFTIITYIHQYA